MAVSPRLPIFAGLCNAANATEQTWPSLLVPFSSSLFLLRLSAVRHSFLTRWLLAPQLHVLLFDHSQGVRSGTLQDQLASCFVPNGTALRRGGGLSNQRRSEMYSHCAIHLPEPFVVVDVCVDGANPRRECERGALSLCISLGR